jgi:hypothetical protein
MIYEEDDFPEDLPFLRKSSFDIRRSVDATRHVGVLAEPSG